MLQLHTVPKLFAVALICAGVGQSCIAWVLSILTMVQQQH